VALDQALAWADACLIGAGTLRAHQCTCLIRNRTLVNQRLAAGRPAHPAAVIVSRSPDFSMSWRFFQQPLCRWLVAPEPMDDGLLRPLDSAGRLLARATHGSWRRWNSAAGAPRWCTASGGSVGGRLRRWVAAHPCATGAGWVAYLASNRIVYFAGEPDVPECLA
jgi:hypothetical protein